VNLTALGLMSWGIVLASFANCGEDWEGSYYNYVCNPVSANEIVTWTFLILAFPFSCAANVFFARRTPLYRLLTHRVPQVETVEGYEEALRAADAQIVFEAAASHIVTFANVHHTHVQTHAASEHFLSSSVRDVSPTPATTAPSGGPGCVVYTRRKIWMRDKPAADAYRAQLGQFIQLHHRDSRVSIVEDLDAPGLVREAFVVWNEPPPCYMTPCGFQILAALNFFLCVRCAIRKRLPEVTVCVDKEFAVE
jgi:hypothetical protein